MPYSPPSSAKPFTLTIPDADLASFNALLALTPLGPKTYENTQESANYGVTYEWLSSAKDNWLTSYSWRAQETHINSFPNYKIQIEDIDVHFIGLFSTKKDAVPIILMHGWPGSFVEFLPLVELVRKRYEGKECPYHIVVPSLPGYTLSGSGPQDKNWTIEDSARILNSLMKELGFGRYIAQGGDVGSFVARVLAAEYEECVGVHLNMFSTREVPDRSTLSPLETTALDRATNWNKTGTAYAHEHATRPSTIGHVLSSNPLALLAWIGEKFLEWTDTSPPLTTILTNVSLYWFTGSFPRSIYPYRALFSPDRAEFKFLDKPTGFSFFPFELFPGLKGVIEKQANLVSYRQHEHGGHFAALEQPEELWDDVEEFVGKAWEGGVAKL
ncbi:epoxide hydrolase-like protein [Massarina eburnea CBS 473.64]|uniref:Epoxide hydrolase-like protein n=1 Tax=Massarina eburnea CBS 473.64 TaxID=1395130 RepID=A0A6A6RWV1_9PLEO|nr:epoxide hydrolase-like protein [Massarina eburnea CBS 473.64]